MRSWFKNSSIPTMPIGYNSGYWPNTSSIWNFIASFVSKNWIPNLGQDSAFNALRTRLNDTIFCPSDKRHQTPMLKILAVFEPGLPVGLRHRTFLEVFIARLAEVSNQKRVTFYTHALTVKVLSQPVIMPATSRTNRATTNARIPLRPGMSHYAVMESFNCRIVRQTSNLKTGWFFSGRCIFWS